MQKVLTQCPACSNPLAVTALYCTVCETGLTGHFATCEFCRLSEEQITFVRLFIQRRGNLSEMEKVLNISYPTVRNKLDEVIRLLQPLPVPPQGGRDAILRRVASGELGAEEALAELKTLGQG